MVQFNKGAGVVVGDWLVDSGANAVVVPTTDVVAA